MIQKQKQKIVAIILFVVVFLTGFLGVRANEKLSQYDFNASQGVPWMSTEHSSFALAHDGTLLKRIEYKNIISDYITVFVNKIAVYIPISDFRFTLLKNLNLEEVSFFGLLSSPIIKMSFLILLFFMISIIYSCKWMDNIIHKLKSILAVIARARAFNSPIHNLIFKYINPLKSYLV